VARAHASTWLRKVREYDRRGLRAEEIFDGTANYLAPLAEKGRKLRAVHLPDEWEGSGAISGCYAYAKMPFYPALSPHTGEGVSWLFSVNELDIRNEVLA
jgi:hypothetical protein